MKLKQSVLIMMAAALPVVSFAASEIPVTKDTATVQAAPADTNKVNRNDLTYRISSTATPEQNRALRSVATKVDRNAVEVVAPNADRYMDRKEVAVSPVESTTDHLDLVFPTVKSVSPIVEKAINTTGRQLSLYDLGGLNKKELVNAIENNQDVKNQLGGEVNIDKMPTEFYTTDDYSVVMVLQQDVDTIHSAGTVYVPVGNLRDRQNDVTKNNRTM